MKLTRFDGGLNTRVDANLIQPTEARQLINVNTNTATLTSEKNKQLAVKNVQRYAYFSTADQRWYSSSIPADFLEFKEVTYKADRVNAPVKLIDGVEYQLGLSAPTGTVTVTPTSAPDPVAQPLFSGHSTGSGTLTTDTYKYKLVVIDPITNLRSYTYYEKPAEESTAKPELIRETLATTVVGTAAAGVRFATLTNGIVESADDSVFIAIANFNPFSSNVYTAYRYFNGKWKQVKPFTYAVNLPIIDDTLDLNSAAELVEEANITGRIQYALTFYDASTGAESAPLITDEVAVVKGYLDLDDIPVSTDPQVDTVRIYRIGGNLTAFSLVDTISNGTTSYRDEVEDTDIIGTILTSANNEPAPVGLKYLVESYAMLFGALDDKLRFTPIGEPDAWPTNFFLDFPAEITGISKTSIGLLVHTYFQTFLVTGTGPTAFAQQLLANDQGCIAHDSIQETKDTAIWASTDGICISDGSDVKVVSRDRLDKLELTVASSALFDQVYYLLQQDNSVLSLDFERGIFKSFDFDVDSLVLANDILYGHNSNDLYALRSTSQLTMTYESPDFIGAGLTVAKTYSNIYMYSSGDITIDVRINGLTVGTYKRTGEKLHEIKLPAAKKRGNYISFFITGTGSVKELYWDEDNANA